MKSTQFANYYNDIQNLKKVYQKKIEIYAGLEIDYFEDSSLEFSNQECKMDFLIGSVHYLKQFSDGTHFCLDYSVSEFERGLKYIFENDIKKLVTHYYSSIVAMANKHQIDIIGHFDLIKKFNSDNKYFNQHDTWYRDLIYKTIDQLKKKNVVFEINTRGNYKGYSKEFYPSNWIIKYLIDNNVPLTINSDAHSPDEIICKFHKVINELKLMQLKYIYVFSKGKWIKEKIGTFT